MAMLAPPMSCCRWCTRSCAASRHRSYRVNRPAIKRSGVKPWHPKFQLLRGCAAVDFLRIGLSERAYQQAMGHSPEVSRKYYLDKFEPGVVSAIDEAEYQAAYELRKGV